MEEPVLSPLLSSALNFLSLAFSVVLLFITAYLWSSNRNKTEELKRIQAELRKVKKTVSTLQDRIGELRGPTIVADVPEPEPFGLDLSEPRLEKITPLAPQEPWIPFVDDYNKLAVEMKKVGQLLKCEKFVREKKLRILNYGGSLTFRPAIDVKDSGFWAFKCFGDEYAVVPNPMNPCDEDLHENGGIKESFALNYEDGTYKKYFVKLPAIFVQDELKGWTLKNPGVVNLERK